jgi:hypothetical protein
MNVGKIIVTSKDIVTFLIENKEVAFWGQNNDYFHIIIMYEMLININIMFYIISDIGVDM